MFNMQQVGKRIIELRKKYNLTQTELADLMNISFQAVSNWERGNSMPDISKLPELAKIFNVTVDELIGENSKLVHFAMADQVEQYVAENEITSEELKTHIPILKPSQVETIMGKTDFSKFDELESFLPFLDEATIGELAEQKALKGESIFGMLPFMDEKAVENIAMEKMKQGESIDAYLPFMSDEAIEVIALEKIRLGQPVEGLFPFLDDDALEKIAEMKLEKGEPVDAMFPFMSDAFIEKVALNKVQKGESIKSMLPFLSDTFLRKVVLNLEK